MARFDPARVPAARRPSKRKQKVSIFRPVDPRTGAVYSSRGAGETPRVAGRSGGAGSPHLKSIFSKLVQPLSKRTRRPRRDGYSLLEILIVISIIALIAALVGPRLFAQLDRSKVTTARVQSRALVSALNTMRLDIGRLPTQEEGLGLLVRADSAQVTGWYGPYLEGALPQDPWGRPYVYTAPTTPEGSPQVISLGSDGQPGGSGLAADVYPSGEAAPTAEK